VLLGLAAWAGLGPAGAGGDSAMTLDQIDAAIRQSIAEKPLESPVPRAYDNVIGSVVRVIGLLTEGDDGRDDREHGPVDRGIGSGVVIVDNGTILTNLHVIAGAKKIRVTFADGSESRRQRPQRPTENDLAVLRAHTIPDDLTAATMRSTGDLHRRSGDRGRLSVRPRSFGVEPASSRA
jgi:S1-C subfamily serine protease